MDESGARKQGYSVHKMISQQAWLTPAVVYDSWNGMVSILLLFWAVFQHGYPYQSQGAKPKVSHLQS